MAARTASLTTLARRASIATTWMLLVSPAFGQALPGFGMQQQPSSFGETEPSGFGTPTPSAFRGQQPTSPGQQPPLALGISVGAGETDNIFRVPTDTTNQTIADLGVDFALKKQTLRLDTDITGDFSYFDYLQNAYSNELVGRFDGLLRAALIPERLLWVFQEDFGQEQVDPFAPVTPDNRQNVNYFATGPELALHLGPNWFLHAGGRYASARYSNSPFDSNRGLGTLEVGRQLSPLSSLSLDATVAHIRFDNSQFPVLDQYGTYLHYEITGARTTVAVNLGGTKVDQGVNTTSGVLARLEVKRRLTPAATLTLVAGRDLTNDADAFSNSRSGALGGITTAPAAQSASSYLSRYGSFIWSYERVRTTVAVSGNWENDSYAQQHALDVRREGVQINVQRRMTSLLSAQVFGSWYESDYSNVSFRDRDYSAGAALGVRTGRRTEVQLRYDHFERSVAGAAGYKENRAFITAQYRFQ